MAEKQRSNTVMQEVDFEPNDYSDGFIAGYLRAHEDGDEYACSVKQASESYVRFLHEGGKSLPVRDVRGW